MTREFRGRFEPLDDSLRPWSRSGFERTRRGPIVVHVPGPVAALHWASCAVQTIDGDEDGTAAATHVDADPGHTIRVLQLGTVGSGGGYRLAEPVGGYWVAGQSPEAPGPCDNPKSCFSLLVCAVSQPGLALTIAGADSHRVPTGESESGSTGAAGEAFCHTWTARPALSRVDFTWKDCHLAAYLPTTCNYLFTFDVCIARGILFEAYDLATGATVTGVTVKSWRFPVPGVPFRDSTTGAILNTTAGIPSPTTADVYWWNLHPAYAASGMDCSFDYLGSGYKPSSIVGRDTHYYVGLYQIVHGYLWECVRQQAWCCDDATQFRVGGLPRFSPDGLWSWLPCDYGLLYSDEGVGWPQIDWGCPGCRAAEDMTYANMDGWAMRVQLDISGHYYRADGALGASPVVSESFTFSDELTVSCDNSAGDSGDWWVITRPTWTSGPMSGSWPIGVYWPVANPAAWAVAHATQIRVLFGISFSPHGSGFGWIAIQVLATDVPAGSGYGVSACAGHVYFPWQPLLAFIPDVSTNAFVQMTENIPSGPCDHHIDWSVTATEPYSSATCRLYGTASAIGPV